MHPLVAPVVAWYSGAARDLPWRGPGRTPWGVLVSEVMLQQTPVSRVEPVWREWLARWPTPADLAAAPTAEVLRAWGTLGYPRRALRLAEAARAVVDNHGSVLPATEVELRALPGVGGYTAAAVVAFAFGGRTVVLDTNVRRVLARALGGTALPPAHLTAAETARADGVVPDDVPDAVVPDDVPEADATAARWSAAVMELGALVCTSRTPRCDACPIAAACAWRAAGYPEPDARRRTQAWAGTDRQARGRLMAVLRSAPGPVPADRLADAWPAEAQRRRALAGLVADGLAVAGGADLAVAGGADANGTPPTYGLPA